jgi:cation:H+ antiporter
MAALVMWTDLALTAAGVAVLAFSGDRLVEFAAALARRARLTPAVIGLTVVAAGTSTPELSVSVAAAVRGSAEIAVANVVGSNIANIGLILGICGLITPVPVHLRLLRFEYPFMVLASSILLLLCRDGRLDRLEGGLFLASAIAFVSYSVWLARSEVDADERRVIGGEVPAKASPLATRPIGLLLAGIAATLAGLGLGAELLLRGAVSMAASLGVSERVIGLTIVAAGTSLPELVASLSAALKKHHEMAMANVVGSNIFNLLMILGATGLVRPIPVASKLVFPDMAVMLAFALALLPLVIRNRRLGRGAGTLLLGGYAAYLVSLLLRPS